MPRVSLRYFAVFKDQAGRAGEVLDTPCATPGELFSEVARAHGFRLRADQCRVALNGEFGSMDHPLRDGDEVVFIPPVAGG